MSDPTIFIIYYSLYGHVRKMAEEMAKGVEKSGAKVKIFQFKETLSDEIVEKMHGIPQSQFPQHPIIDVNKLAQADGFLFGYPTRFGMMSAQCKAFWDSTSKYWLSKGLSSKPAGMFFSTGSLGGGQETTALTAITQLVHHGMVFVPIGYGCKSLLNLDEVHGGSPYGAGTIAGLDGKKQPSKLELEIASYQGEYMGYFCKKLHSRWVIG